MVLPDVLLKVSLTVDVDMKIKLVSLCCLAVSISACSEAPGPVETPPPAVSVVTVKDSRLKIHREFIGRTSATTRVDLRARVTGTLEQRLFEEGATVAAGDVLYRIEADSYEAAVTQATAQLESDKARLREAKTNEKRIEKLVLSQTISDQEADSARTTTLVAAAALQASEAALQRAKLDLQHTTILAPSAGVIGETNINVGNLVGPDTGVLATLIALDPIAVHFTVSDVEYLNFRRDAARREADNSQSLLRPRLRLSNGEDYDHAGNLELIGNEIDPGTGTLTLRASFPNSLKLLRPGQFVTVVFDGESDRSALAVPQQAVLTSGAGRSVLVVGDDHRVEQRPVEIGDASNGFFVVKSGLASGERVVTRGLQKVRPGETVNVTVEE